MCGIATYFPDGSATGNLNDGGEASFARVDRGCWQSSDYSPASHELTHMLGAVQGGAPHATSYGHCTDEYDAMCYNDGSGMPMQTVCAKDQNWLLDCRNDDYFHTSPAAGSYLATHWNVANSSFLDVVAPLGSPTNVTVTKSRDSAETGDIVTFTASAPTGYTYRWTLSSSKCTTTGAASATVKVTCNEYFSGILTASVVATAPDGQTVSADSKVTIRKAAEPTVSVAAPPVAPTDGNPFTLYAHVQGKAPFTYYWTVPSGCDVAGGDSPAAFVTCTGPTRDGVFQVEVDQADGQMGASPTLPVTLRASGASFPTPADTLKSRVVAGTSPADPAAGTTLTASSIMSANYSWSVRSGDGCALSAATGSTSRLTCAAGFDGFAVIDVDVTTPEGEHLVVAAGPRLVPGAVSDRYAALTATRGRVRTPVILRGRLLDAASGDPIGGAPVVLQARWAGSSHWVRVKAVTTASDGTVKVRNPLPRPGSFRLRFTGDASYPPVVSGDFFYKAPTRFALGFSSSRPHVFRGQLAFPDLEPIRHAVVKLQRRYVGARRWVAVRTTRTDLRGRVGAVYAPGHRADIRWVYPGSKVRWGSRSRPVRVDR